MSIRTITRGRVPMIERSNLPEPNLLELLDRNKFQEERQLVAKYFKGEDREIYAATLIMYKSTVPCKEYQEFLTGLEGKCTKGSKKLYIEITLNNFLHA